ncbi:MAG TPA: 50S ribosomal protein L1 [Actinomycetota bacterium]
MGQGKRFDDSVKAIDREALHTPTDALKIIKELPAAKFDESVEVAFRLGVDPRKADQMIRGTVALPNGTGKTVRVAAFAVGDKAREAKEAGADVVGGEDLVAEVLKGNMDFEAAVATPDMMPVVGKAGRVLGPRGLMPNPKAGTVSDDIGKAVADIKGGKIEYRTDKGANVHVAIGKRSFEERALVENYLAVVDEILRAKPSAAKGRYVKGVTMSTTMGPGIRIDPARIRGIEADEPSEAPAGPAASADAGTPAEAGAST